MREVEGMLVRALDTAAVADLPGKLKQARVALPAIPPTKLQTLLRKGTVDAEFMRAAFGDPGTKVTDQQVTFDAAH